MRALWRTKKGYTHGLSSAPKKLKSAGDKRLVIEDVLCIQGLEVEIPALSNQPIFFIYYLIR